MTARNNLGKSIYFSAALPATHDVAGFEALSWTELEGAQTLPQFGITHGNIDVPSLKTGFSSGVKGIASGVDTQGSCFIDDSTLTVNQLAFKAICESNGGAIALKIASGEGPLGALTTGDTVEYAQGYVHSYQENQPNEGSYEGFTYNFKQNVGPAIKSTEPA